MKKVFIVHGFEGKPNGGWRPWLMAELDARDIYACALPMPDPCQPELKKWMEEIHRAVSAADDDVILVGHSLGTVAVLHYLQNMSSDGKFEKVFLISGTGRMISELPQEFHNKLKNFFETPFIFPEIQKKARLFNVFHGDNDETVPYSYGVELAESLRCPLITIKNGGHLNRDSGWLQLPELLDKILK